MAEKPTCDPLARYIKETSGDYWIGWHRHADGRPRSDCLSREARRGWDARHRLAYMAARI